ncbi:MAG: DUF1540 domain-containing protein [Negativibacillus sp.]
MTKLTCNAAHCASNKDNCCCRPAIKVQGQHAEMPCDTRCQSFTEKGEEISNSTHFDTVNNSLEVKCTAMNCVFNQEGDCKAEGIHINGAGARSYSETECSSFSLQAK